MVVEAAPVVPGQEDRSGVPVGSAHQGVDQVGDVPLPVADLALWVLADRRGRRRDQAGPADLS